MAKYAGKGGEVHSTSGQVGQIDNWTYQEQSAVVEDYYMGASAMSQHTTAKSASAQIVCFWDPDDVGLADLTVGNSIALVLGPEGNTLGDEILEGTVEVSSYQIDNPKDGYVKVTIGTIGVMTWGTA